MKNLFKTLSFKSFVKEGFETVIENQDILLSEVEHVSKPFKKDFSVNSEVYSKLIRQGAIGYQDGEVFFITSFITKITFQSGEVKTFFGVSPEEIKTIRASFVEEYSQQLLKQSSDLLKLFQPTKVSIKIK